ncbi:UDP-glucose--hexose-1-phosphate uridylyltransferase [Sphingorhabdus wooponensis]|uniref:Galactose-1-phosphate uridylyltransferase n=1 Tax=Sphingorhabdus wooponensis TaxID=940136 RepID=A0A3R8Q273_9SPHN|nr:UDP-glucose--hexose-1-phosphate uridylyltransferase [Sphingorhabdus wooponensis]RRQ51558.1 UDP-glucose--hexose-1-phosphate uridylyltransferase [Sphingorhabdus wooponensis]
MSFHEQPHRRFNPLKNEWILVSPHRAKRPWQGQQDIQDTAVRPAHDPDCYLCAGNERAGGLRNPDYKNVFIFDNDFAALMPSAGCRVEKDKPLFRAALANGACRVMCFSPDHGKTLPEMPVADIRTVVDSWAAQEKELSAVHAYVQIFENKGAMMGCSSPHPHGQIWATDYVPAEPEREDAAQAEWFEQHQSAMLLTYAAQEADDGARTVAQNDHWIAVVPYWASWPYEILLLPRFAVQHMHALAPEERDALADIMKAVTIAYDNLFQTSFPYSMGWHGAPSATPDAPHWQLHAHFYPPLLRSASVRKFMVGYEMLAEAQRDLTPEAAAAHLRATDKIHYRSQR